MASSFVPESLAIELIWVDPLVKISGIPNLQITDIICVCQLPLARVAIVFILQDENDTHPRSLIYIP